jgi:hypothetical protein
MSSLGSYLGRFFPLTQTRDQTKSGLQTRFDNNFELCFDYVNEAGERLNNKGIGLLTYDALLITSYTIPIAGAEGLSLTGKIGVFLSVISALLIMWQAFVVRWSLPDQIENASEDFTEYVKEVANRTIAINVAVALSIFATIPMLARVFC